MSHQGHAFIDRRILPVPGESVVDLQTSVTFGRVLPLRILQMPLEFVPERKRLFIAGNVLQMFVVKLLVFLIIPGFRHPVQQPPGRREIRTPDTASEVLRAATSGHLVLSTIHANNIADAINSVVKYASSTTMSEELAYDLFSRGILGVMHQTLIGVHDKRPAVNYLFANPDTTKGDQVRGIIKGGNLNLGTSIETQMTRMRKGMNLFPDLS